MSRIKVWLSRYSDRPNYLLLWRDPITKRVRSKSTKTSNRKEAEAAKNDLETDLNRGVHNEPSKMKWSDFIERYEVEKLSGCRENTQAKAGYVFDSFAAKANPQTIGTIDERMLSRYAATLRADGRSPATIQGNLAYLRAALRWANDQKIIPSVPKFPKVSIPKGSNRRKVRAAASITTEAFERILDKAPNDGWRLFLSFCWHCGMRRAEARSVRGADVDLQRHRISIPINKAGDLDATVIISPDLDQLLRDTWPCGLPEGPLVTVADVPSDLYELTKQFKKIARKACVKGGGADGLCTLHDLRRAFGSRWAARVPAQVLQRMMRHADIKTTMDFYADVEEAAHDAVWGNQPAKASTPAMAIA